MSLAETPNLDSMRLIAQFTSMALESPEQKQSRIFGAIANRLQDPEIVRWQLESLGRIALYGQFATDLQPLGDEAWERLIDHEQPTIGFRYHTQCEIAFSRASQKLRRSGEDTPNAVLLAWPRAFAKEREGSRGYSAERGMLVDDEGVIYFGNFPEPLQIHAAQSSATPLVYERRFGKKLHHFNDYKIERLLEDKSATAQLLDKLSLPHATVLAEATAADLDVAGLFEAKEPFVIKPCEGERGFGVRIVHPDTDTADDIKRYVETGYPADMNLVAERLLTSVPFKHPDSGASLDWNLRAIVMGDAYVGAYARAGLRGSPINLATGAEAYSLEEAFDNCGFDNEQRALVTQRVTALCEATKQTGAGMMGLDIIIDENLQPSLIEINGEKSGGLENIMLAGKETIDWEPGYAAVRGMARFIKAKGRISSNQTGKRNSFRLTIDEILASADWAGNHKELGDEIMEFTKNQLSHYYLLPDTSRKAAMKFLDEQSGKPTEETESNYFVIRSQMEKLLEEEKRDELYALFNKAVAHNPNDIPRIEAFASFICENDQETIARYSLMELQQEANPENAKALSTMKYYVLLSLTERDVMAVSHETRQLITDALAAFYILPLTERTPQLVTDVIHSVPEADYLKPVSRYFRGFANLTATMEDVIAVQHEAFMSPLESDGKFMESIAGMICEEKTEASSTAIGIAKLHHDDLAGALADFRLVDPNNQELLGDAVLTIGRYLINHVVRSDIPETSGEDIMNLTNYSLFANENGLRGLTKSSNETTALCANLLLSAHYLIQGDLQASHVALSSFHGSASTSPETDSLFAGAYEHLFYAIDEQLEILAQENREEQ